MTALVVLTQAAEGGESLAQQVTAGGLPVEHWPMVRLAPVPEHAIAPVLRRLDEFDWILLPSPSAVRLVAATMKTLGITWPARIRAGLVGPASVEAFRDCFGDGPAVDTPSLPPHDAAHLIALLPDRPGDDPAGETGIRALVLNRPDGRTHWLEALERKVRSVEVAAAYTAEPLLEEPPAELMWRLRRLCRVDGGLLWVVGAASHLDTLLRSLPVDLASWAKRQPLLVPHAAIMAHARAAGFDQVVVYEDRRDLVERLQYLAISRGRTSPEPADQHADNEDKSEEPPALSLDQPKASATSGAGQDDKVSDAKVIGETSTATAGAVAKTPAASGPASSTTAASAGSSAPPSSASTASTPAPSAPASTASTATAASPPSSAASPAAASSSAGTAARQPFSSPPPRMPDPPAPVPPSAAGNGGRRGGGWWALPLLLLVLLLALGGWWYTQQRFLATERDNARRVQEAETRSGRLEEQIRTLRDSQSQLLARSSTLESKIAESANQQEQLASLYDEMAKSRGDSTLAEVEQSVMMANQHLELTGNIQAALLALENAQRRLGDSEQSQAIGARRVILQDIEKLKALPEVDIARAAARLDQIINRVDRLPLLADASEAAAAPAAPSTAPAPAAATTPAATTPAATTSATAAPATDAAGGAPAAPPAAAAEQPSPAAAADASTTASAASPAGTPAEERSTLRRLYASLVEHGARSLDAVREEFRSLVTIRRIDRPDSLLLSPEQKQTARDNLKLLLLNARLNLLSRHQELFRQDLTRVMEAMQRLFDTEHPDVKTVIATLQSLQAQPLAQELPSLSESLAAVKAARAASEKRS